MTYVNVEPSSKAAHRPASDLPMTQMIASIIAQFEQLLHTYVLFNLAFLALGIVEFFILLFCFTFLVKSALLSFTLAVVFLTFFSYCILRVYLQTQRSAQFEELKERYLGACKSMFNCKEDLPESHVLLANACVKLSDTLKDKELSYYQLPTWLQVASPYMEKLSSWWHWHDTYQMREQLLLSAVEETIKLVKCEPTNLEVHAALANAYVVLSGLYVDPRKNLDEERWIWNDRFLQLQEKKFRVAATRAIEEFKILKEFSPDDSWIHLQLAYSYHDLKMPLDEIREYEIVLKLQPNNEDIQFKLGALYFQQGLNAQGLGIYEMLKKHSSNKAEELISLYGEYNPFKSVV